MLMRPLYSTCLAQQELFAARFAFKQLPKQAIARRPLSSSTHQLPLSQTSRSPSSMLYLLAGGGAASSLFYLYQSRSNPLRCDAPTTSAGRPYAEPHTPSLQGPGSASATPLRSSRTAKGVEHSFDLRSLSFGAIAGISTGIFIRKGLGALGFLLGGAFVFLQYMASRGMVNINWTSLASSYERKLENFARSGKGPNTLARVGSRVTDFLLADFPPRASFLAGLGLGLRMG